MLFQVTEAKPETRFLNLPTQRVTIWNNKQTPRLYLTLSIHGTCIFAYMNGWLFYGFHVGKYTNRPMDHMGDFNLYILPVSSISVNLGSGLETTKKGRLDGHRNMYRYGYLFRNEQLNGHGWLIMLHRWPWMAYHDLKSSNENYHFGGWVPPEITQPSQKAGYSLKLPVPRMNMNLTNNDACRYPQILTWFFNQQKSMTPKKIASKSKPSTTKYRGTPMENPTKMDDLGVPLFSETSKSNGSLFFNHPLGSPCHCSINGFKLFGLEGHWFGPESEAPRGPSSGKGGLSTVVGFIVFFPCFFFRTM